MTDEDWDLPEARCLGLLLGGDAGELFDSTGGRQELDDGFVVLFNAFHEAVPFMLPADEPRRRWELLVDTARERGRRRAVRAEAATRSSPLAGRAGPPRPAAERRRPIRASRPMPRRQPPVRRRGRAPPTEARRERHDMPFGAASGRRDRQVPPLGARRRAGRARAPGARRIARPMRPLGDGWHELVAAAAPGEPLSLPPAGRPAVPDPASRCQPDDVHGPSWSSIPRAYAWQHADWTGRPWHEAVVYELHVGTFTPGGHLRGAASQRLPHLAELGVTAVELMPLADFAGPAQLGLRRRAAVRARRRLRHARRPEGAWSMRRMALGLMVLLDVVYNHFGPEGNYLRAYAPASSPSDFHTPWGAAIDFAAPSARCATSSSTTRSTGSRSTASTACASMPCTRSATQSSRTSWSSWRGAVRDGTGRDAPRASGARERRTTRRAGSVADDGARPAALRRAVERRRPPRRCTRC